MKNNKTKNKNSFKINLIKIVLDSFQYYKKINKNYLKKIIRLIRI